MQGRGGPWLSPNRRAHSSLTRRNSLSDKQLLSLDVPAVELADTDSLFLECSGLLVHYKEALPQVCSDLAHRAWGVLCATVVLPILWLRAAARLGRAHGIVHSVLQLTLQCI